MILEITRDNLPAVLMFLASLAAAFGLGYTHAWWKRNTVNDALLDALRAARRYVRELENFRTGALEHLGYTGGHDHASLDRALGASRAHPDYIEALRRAGLDPASRYRGKETDK